jgi:hypothetical protein
MNRLRPRTTVLSGATIGLIAGAAIYGAVSSSATDKAPTAAKPASASVAAAPVSAARCAAGQKLEKGVCIVHVQRTVVLPAAGGGAPSLNSGSNASSGLPGSSEPAEPRDDSAAGATHEAEHDGESEASEHEGDHAEHAQDAAEHAADSNG